MLKLSLCAGGNLWLTFNSVDAIREDFSGCKVLIGGEWFGVKEAALTIVQAIELRNLPEVPNAD